MGRQGEDRGPVDTSGSPSRIFMGRANCVVGLISVLWGVFSIGMVYAFFGIMLGVMGYALGARRLGAATVSISAVALVFLLAAAQGYIPGIEPTGFRSIDLAPLR